MDIQMPRMDGLTATGRIRQKEKSTRIHMPVIAMTAHAMSGDRERCIEAGMDGYISKPINSQHLDEAITSAMRGRGDNGLVQNSETNEADVMAVSLSFLLRLA